MAHPVLEEIRSFAFCTDNEDLFFFIQPFDLSVYLCQIHEEGPSDRGLRLHVCHPVSLRLAGRVLCGRHADECTVQLIHHYIDCLHKRMDRSRKRRRICKIRVLKIFQDGAHVHAHDRNVHHLVHLSRSEHLHAEEFSRCTVCDQLRDEEGCVRVIVRLVICGHKHSLHVISRFSRLCLSQSGTSDVEPRKLYHSCAEHARICLLSACEHLCQSPAFHICRRAHG